MNPLKTLYRLACFLGLADLIFVGYLCWEYEFGSGHGLHPGFFLLMLFLVFVGLRIPMRGQGGPELE
jgi:hypothetical protein